MKLQRVKIILFIICITLSSTSTSSELSQGCMYRGELKFAGERVYIDDRNPKTIKWHGQFKEKHGHDPDGGAYKLAICTVLVDLSKNDVSDVSEREWIWVQDVSNGGLAESYSDSAKDD